MSGSVGLVDFIVGLVENVLHLPNIFWTFFGDPIRITVRDQDKGLLGQHIQYTSLTMHIFHFIPANYEIGRSSAGELKPLHKLLYGRDGRVCFRNQYLCLYFILSLFRCIFPTTHTVVRVRVRV